jgi:hypothetical protein
MCNRSKNVSQAVADAKGFAKALVNFILRAVHENEPDRPLRRLATG